MVDHMIKSIKDDPDGIIQEDVLKAVLLDTVVAGIKYIIFL